MTSRALHPCNPGVVLTVLTALSEKIPGLNVLGGREELYPFQPSIRRVGALLYSPLNPRLRAFSRDRNVWFAREKTEGQP